MFLIINTLRNLASYTISDFKQKVVRPSPLFILALARPAAPALAVFACKDTGSAGRLMTSFNK